MAVAQACTRQGKQGCVGELEENQAEHENVKVAVPCRIAQPVPFARIVPVGRGSRHGVIDILLADRKERDQRREAERAGGEERRVARSETAHQPHRRHGGDIAERAEALVAPQPAAQRRVTHEPEPDGRQRDPEHACGSAIEHLGRHDRPEPGPEPKEDGAASHHAESDRHQEALGGHRVHQGATGQLACDGGDAADRKREADLAGRPSLHRKKHGNERPEAGLDVGDEEAQPVEPPLAALRGRGMMGIAHGCGCLTVSSRSVTVPVCLGQVPVGLLDRRRIE